MSNFLTLEDVDAIIMKYGAVNTFYECNTRKIGTGLFSEMTYDFISINHTSTGFTFRIENSAWTGGYYFLDANGEYINSNASYNSNTKTITLTTSQASVTLVLYMSLLSPSFSFKRLTWRPVTLNPVISTYPYKDMIEVPIIDFTGSKSVGTILYGTRNGVNIETFEIINGENNTKYLQTYSVPSEANGTLLLDNTFYYHRFDSSGKPRITVSGDLILGTVNKVSLNVPSIYHTVSGAIKGTVSYHNKEVPIVYENSGGVGGYYCTIDLTNIYDIDHLTLNVNLEQTRYCQESSIHILVDCNYVTVNNFEELKSALRGKVGVINISSNIVMSTDYLVISNNVKIISENNSTVSVFNPIIISNGVSADFENIKFIPIDNGSRGNRGCFIQHENSTLNIIGCEFHNFKNWDLGQYRGSCIFCTSSHGGFEEDDDFNTTIKDTLFVNNVSCILHGGQLLVDNCRMLVTDPDSLFNSVSSQFLYQTDGDAVIRNSVFDIDYSGDSLCSNERNIGYGQALVFCGLNATINGVNREQLQIKDNSLPFFNAPFNNQSHLFAKYYYTDISACVVVSPELGKEDKSLAYAVSDDEYIYKEGVQITRASWNAENTNRKIVWEDI